MQISNHFQVTRIFVLRGAANCGRKTQGDDAYYCNRELMELLIFDAKVTNTSYRTWKFESAAERALIEKYNATLRFVATMSGLTRWQFIFGEVEVDTDREFGDYHTTAVDETWYKMAILQHQIDAESFVYLVPHVNEPLEDSDLKVTASHAIFPRNDNGGIEAPASVVGFQFSHSLMYERFMEITSKVNVSLSWALDAALTGFPFCSGCFSARDALSLARMICKIVM